VILTTGMPMTVPLNSVLTVKLDAQRATIMDREHAIV